MTINNIEAKIIFNWRSKIKEKARKKSNQIKLLESLNCRCKLEYAKQQYLINLKKGLEGEEVFDKWMDNYLGQDVTLLKDRLLSFNGSTAQIDALLFIGNTLRLYEVKNYEGDYQQHSGHFRTSKGQEFICPSIQLKRAEKVLQQVVGQWTHTLEIKSYVIFVNLAFTLYDATRSNPFILPTQIKNHFERLKSIGDKTSKNNNQFINKLMLETKSSGKYRGTTQEYDYEEFRKGLICSECYSFNLIRSQRKATCRDCGEHYSIDQLLMNQIDEVHLLFPEIKVTSSLVYDWIGGEINKRRIGRLLKTLA